LGYGLWVVLRVRVLMGVLMRVLVGRRRRFGRCLVGRLRNGSKIGGGLESMSKGGFGLQVGGRRRRRLMWKLKFGARRWCFGSGLRSSCRVLLPGLEEPAHAFDAGEEEYCYKERLERVGLLAL
jgi:hypothetical protein